MLKYLIDNKGYWELTELPSTLFLKEERANGYKFIEIKPNEEEIRLEDLCRKLEIETPQGWDRNIAGVYARFKPSLIKEAIKDGLTREGCRFLLEVFSAMGIEAEEVESIKISLTQEGPYYGVFCADVKLRNQEVRHFGLNVVLNNSLNGDLQNDYQNLNTLDELQNKLGLKLVPQPYVFGIGRFKADRENSIEMSFFAVEWLSDYCEIHRDRYVNRDRLYLLPNYIQAKTNIIEKILNGEESACIRKEIICLLALIFASTFEEGKGGLVIKRINLNNGDFMARAHPQGKFDICLITAREFIRLSTPNEFIDYLIQYENEEYIEKKLTADGIQVRTEKFKFYKEVSEIKEAIRGALVKLYGEKEGLAITEKWFADYYTDDSIFGLHSRRIAHYSDGQEARKRLESKENQNRLKGLLLAMDSRDMNKQKQAKPKLVRFKNQKIKPLLDIFEAVDDFDEQMKIYHSLSRLANLIHIPELMNFYFKTTREDKKNWAAILLQSLMTHEDSILTGSPKNGNSIARTSFSSRLAKIRAYILDLIMNNSNSAKTVLDCCASDCSATLDVAKIIHEQDRGVKIIAMDINAVVYKLTDKEGNFAVLDSRGKLIRLDREDDALAELRKSDIPKLYNRMKAHLKRKIEVTNDGIAANRYEDGEGNRIEAIYLIHPEAIEWAMSHNLEFRQGNFFELTQIIPQESVDIAIAGNTLGECWQYYDRRDTIEAMKEIGLSLKEKGKLIVGNNPSLVSLVDFQFHVYERKGNRLELIDTMGEPRVWKNTIVEKSPLIKSAHAQPDTLNDPFSSFGDRPNRMRRYDSHSAKSNDMAQDYEVLDISKQLDGFTSLTELAGKLGIPKSTLSPYLKHIIDRRNRERINSWMPAYKLFNERTVKAMREIIKVVEQEGGKASITTIAQRLKKNRKVVSSVVKQMDFDLINWCRKVTGRLQLEIIRLQPDKTRQKIIQAMKELGNEASVKQITDRSGLPDSTVSDHLKKIKQGAGELPIRIIPHPRGTNMAKAQDRVTVSRNKQQPQNVREKKAGAKTEPRSTTFKNPTIKQSGLPNPTESRQITIVIHQDTKVQDEPAGAKDKQQSVETKPLVSETQIVPAKEGNNNHTIINSQLFRQYPGQIIEEAQRNGNNALEFIKMLNGVRKGLIQRGYPPALATLLARHYKDLENAVKGVEVAVEAFLKDRDPAQVEFLRELKSIVPQEFRRLFNDFSDRRPDMLKQFLEFPEGKELGDVPQGDTRPQKSFDRDSALRDDYGQADRGLFGNGARERVSRRTGEIDYLLEAYESAERAGLTGDTFDRDSFMPFSPRRGLFGVRFTGTRKSSHNISENEGNNNTKLPYVVIKKAGAEYRIVGVNHIINYPAQFVDKVSKDSDVIIHEGTMLFGQSLISKMSNKFFGIIEEVANGIIKKMTGSTVTQESHRSETLKAGQTVLNLDLAKKHHNFSPNAMSKLEIANIMLFASLMTYVLNFVEMPVFLFYLCIATIFSIFFLTDYFLVRKQQNTYLQTIALDFRNLIHAAKLSHLPKVLNKSDLIMTIVVGAAHVQGIKEYLEDDRLRQNRWNDYLTQPKLWRQINKYVDLTMSFEIIEISADENNENIAQIIGTIADLPGPRELLVKQIRNRLPRHSLAARLLNLFNCRKINNAPTEEDLEPSFVEEIFNELLAELESTQPEAEIQLVKHAFIFAKQAHKGQIRKDRVTPYISHPLIATLILLSELALTNEET
ncbi:MAG: ArsR family transcriptional regulator, partial [Candidatus Omnitrophica bacterium]|nr:ArsR family transcriptional regulator [Candidatus Omnitrophota bacterium]